jgi:5-carboxymethyl-2-hydroxymuconic-semialdehyde dehydrogenase
MTSTLADNLEKSERLLERFRGGTLGHFIGGRHEKSHGEESIEDVSPVDGSVLCRVASGDEYDVDRAAQAARAAFATWRGVSGTARRAILHKIAALIEARAEEIALIECMDTGQALRFMSKAAERGAENFRFFADRAPDASDGLSLPAAEHLNYTLRQPLGAVGVITPWNTPFMLSTWKIAPGVPPGVVNLVNGLGEQTGRLLTEHPAIRATAFIGESRTGSLIMSQGAPTLKRVHLELGGKNPVIVFDDANLERALDAVVFMIYSLNGERCTSSSRLLVQRSIHDRFIERVAERIGRLRVGHPLDPATEIGPLIHQRHLEKVLGYLALARAEGANVRCGGHRAEQAGSGYYIEPTLLTGARSDMRVAREEIFGPVLTVVPFEDEAEALSIANDVPYGLAAYLWTESVGRALRMAQAIEAGMVWVNSENNRHLPTPFGGMKASGIGRDGGDYSFDFYMETKNICLAHGTHRVPKLGAA